MPRLKSYWNAKANALMTPDQRKASDERYIEWQKGRDLNSRAKWNAASVERARQWALDNPEEAKKRRKAARVARKARKLEDPVYADNHKALRRKYKATYRSKPSGRRSLLKDHLKPKGWTLERYDAALQEQGNRCAICREPFPKAPNADHKHSDPPVPRGLLCKLCNSMLGFSKERPEVLEAAAAYLRSFQIPECGTPIL